MDSRFRGNDDLAAGMATWGHPGAYFHRNVEQAVGSKAVENAALSTWKGYAGASEPNVHASKAAAGVQGCRRLVVLRPVRGSMWTCRRAYAWTADDAPAPPRIKSLPYLNGYCGNVLF